MLRSRRYAPLTVLSLHRRFARVKPTPLDIQRFANRYGLLGHLEVQDLEATDSSSWVGESLRIWRNELRVMRGLMELWDAVRQGREKVLAPFIYWHDAPKLVRIILAGDDRELLPTIVRRIRQRSEDLTEGLLAWDQVPDGAWAATQLLVADARLAYLADAPPSVLQHWEYGDPIEPTRYFIHAEVNERIRGHVSPAVLPFRKSEIQFFPDCLLAAMYTHFLLELSGRTRPAILCAREGCGRYFEPEHGRQAYCDPRCRKLAHYHRSSARSA
jgi:hypothetical protein